jgi:P-type Cu2+ transporter
MSCCAAGTEAALELGACSVSEEALFASRPLGDGVWQTDLSVPGAHSANCIRSIEGGLSRLDGVEKVRVNLSARRVHIIWRGVRMPPIIETLSVLGYDAHLSGTDTGGSDPELSRLIRALAVAGFSAMNIMLLSVSVWSGADEETRQAFHLVSAILALPALLYSGQVFFGSAWRVLRSGHTNMDVPVSIGICLTFAISFYDTIETGRHAYFDAATSLIFVLLIGRTLDHAMRNKARSAIHGLARLVPRGAIVLLADGSEAYIALEEIQPGMRIRVAAGDRVPVDGCVEQGTSELDCSLATGESAPQHVGVGSKVVAGNLNLNGPLVVVAEARAEDSFIAEMARMMAAVENARPAFQRLADRAARLYGPIVHSTAALTLVGWLLVSGDWHRSVSVAIAVLIITCPCALGLAAPIVHAVATGRLFKNGVMVKDGSGLERLAEIDTVVFDKTGTLTSERLRLLDTAAIEPDAPAIAAAIAAHSRHPQAMALAAAFRTDPVAQVRLSDIAEHPGSGIEARLATSIYRLGRVDWAASADEGVQSAQLVLARSGHMIAAFEFASRERPGVAKALRALREDGMRLLILSGDQHSKVASFARRYGIEDHAGSLLPGAKVDRIAALSADGHKVLMVGDGLNDAPALAAAHVSMAPANAADISRNAADFVFLHESLAAVPLAVAIARKARSLVRQNVVIAVAYNVIAMPIAIAGHVTPLIAALAMSVSSITVVGNALRLHMERQPRASAWTMPRGRPNVITVAAR